MSDVIKVLIALVALGFIVLSLTVAKPASDGGKLAQKVLFINAVGWLVTLPFSTRGHPPPWLIVFVLFWLMNCLLIPVAGIALWNGRKDDERRNNLLLSGFYVVLNVSVLFLLPLIELILAS